MKSSIFIALFSLYSAAAFAQGTAFTYQGELNSAAGGVSGLYDFRFAVYDSPSGGTQIGGTLTTNAVAVANGLFTVTLDFGANVFTGNARWLDLAAHTNNSPNAFVSMTPRQQLTPAPYAIYAASSAGVSGLTLRQVTGTDASDLIAGSVSNAIDAGVRGSVIAGGGTGVTSLTNHISSDFSSIGGGDGNTIQAGAQNSFIGAGQYNVITNGSYYSVIVGGSYNSEANSCYYSFIGGGSGNRVSSLVGVLVGGSDNYLSGSYSFLGGGENNQVISASDSFLGGGSGNTIQQFDGDSVLVGGQQNSVGAIYSFLGGGLFNTNKGQYSSIVGGRNNNASGNGSFIGGGGFASIGNFGNTASGEATVISGGISNTASGNESVVSGGSANAAQGQYSMVPGGSLNVASGMFSFAAGNQGKATNNGAFVWADSQAANFSSTNGDSFNVRAQGGVKFVTSGAGVTVDGVPIGGGGNFVTVQTDNSVVGGGQNNLVQSGISDSFIGGGLNNTNLAAQSFIGAGNNNTVGVNGSDGFIAGGSLNAVNNQWATVLGGVGNQANGVDSLTLGGLQNVASGTLSLAAGDQAQATNQGAFVWADSQGVPFASTNSDSFNVRAQGGIRFVTGGAGITVDGQSLFGVGNSNTSATSVISGGENNSITNDATACVLGGGQGNTINFSPYGFLGGGQGNSIIETAYDVLGGGQANSISNNSYDSFLGGGSGNSIQTFSYFSFLGGGSGNLILSPFSFLGGGEGNSIPQNADHSFVGGGQDNTNASNLSFLGGGGENSINGSSSYSFIGGGTENTILQNANGSFLGGGAGNHIEASSSFLGGGEDGGIGENAHSSFLGSGQDNSIQSGSYNSFLGGGDENVIQPNADHSFLGGGENNTIMEQADHCFLGGGSRNTNSGEFSSIVGGTQNVAAGTYSFAAGQQAQALNEGAFVWADSQNTAFASTANDQFSARATGGVRFITKVDGFGFPAAGVFLNPGDTSWNTISDRNAKKNFAAVNGKEILERLAAIPIEKWNYKWEADTNTPNIGPMAQDFKAAFFPGRDDKKISTLEFDGVELAAIQGLNQKLNDKDSEIAELKARLDALEKMVRNQK